MNCPQLKKREKNIRNNFEYDSLDYWPWTRIECIEDGDYLNDKYLYFSIQDVVFANTEDQFEELFPLSKNSKLGIEYTLARGNYFMCFAVDNPTGHNNFLKYKAADDLRSFQKLLQKRILERESFILKITNINNTIEVDYKSSSPKYQISMMKKSHQ